MILVGAPEVVVLDASATDPEVARLLDVLGLDVVPGDVHGVTLDRPAVGVFADDHPQINGCYAWYVGPGTCPAWMRPAPGQAGLVLSLLGTALAQERAGAAFRAAGEGLPTPTRVRFDKAGVLGGISAAVSPRGLVDPGVPVRPELTRDALLWRAFRSIRRCCQPGGAIAAAPPRTSPDEPDYGFFWQRDGAAAAAALLGLSRTGPKALRVLAGESLAGYLRFVTELGRKGALSASRTTLAGLPVGGYGDPQHDGPAATALVLLAALEDPREALAAARPFLDHLVGLGVDSAGYDLWELVHGRSFHALNLRRRALARAAEVGALVDDSATPVWDRLARSMSQELSTFVDSRRAGLVHSKGADPPWFLAISRLDMSVIGSELLLPGPDPLAVGPTLALLEQAYADRWPVNTAWRSSGQRGLGLGRFPEDTNDGLGSTGAGPWPVTTLWGAQWHLLRGDRATGLGHLAFVLAHGAGGSEQIDGFTGVGKGMRGLAWSAAELATTLLLVDAGAAPV